MTDKPETVGDLLAGYDGWGCEDEDDEQIPCDPSEPEDGNGDDNGKHGI
jgi:hypothetical protein